MNFEKTPAAEERGNAPITEADLHQTLASSQEARKKGMSAVTLGVILLAAGAILANREGLFFAGAAIMVVGVILLGKGLSTLSKARAEVKAKLSQTVIPEVLSGTFEHVQYDPNGHIDDGVIHGTHMFFPFHFTDIGGSDLIRATYKGVPIEMSDITLTEIFEYTEVDDHDGGEEKHTRTSNHFNGQWLTCRFPRKLSADLCVFESNPRLRPDDLIETGDEAFDERFGVSCSSTSDAASLLTPAALARIQSLSDRAGGNIYLRFLREGKVHMAVHSRRNLFDPDDRESGDLESVRRQIRNDAQYAADLIDAVLAIGG